MLVALLAVGLLAAGCGSSSKSSSPPSSSASTTTTTTTAAAQTDSGALPPCPTGTRTCVLTQTNIKPAGPSSLTENLKALMAKSDAFLQDVRLTCPPLTAYPLVCTVAATDVLKKSHPVPVVGEVKILGVYTGTRTYAFSVNVAPPQKK